MPGRGIGRTAGGALRALVALAVVGQFLGCGEPPPPPPPEVEHGPKPGPEGPPPRGMVLVRGGYFTIGSDRGDPDEAPVHRVGVDGFYIDAREVTNAEFERFVAATGYDAEGEWERFDRPGRESHPVLSVTWNDATAYAGWAGKRLPTEAEWEVAARGGIEDGDYPNGETVSPDEATYGSLYASFPATTPVGSRHPNGYGIYDMAGNAWEWCADYYAADAYARSAELNPRGPERGVSRVLRGGSWNDRAVTLRVANRLEMTPTIIGPVFGFRCAKTP